MSVEDLIEPHFLHSILCEASNNLTKNWFQSLSYPNAFRQTWDYYIFCCWHSNALARDLLHIYQGCRLIKYIMYNNINLVLATVCASTAVYPLLGYFPNIEPFSNYQKAWIARTVLIAKQIALRAWQTWSQLSHKMWQSKIMKMFVKEDGGWIISGYPFSTVLAD